MKRHFTAYFEAYLTGALFFVLQIALGFVAVGKSAPLDVRMKWTSFDWYTFKANVIIFAFPTILAFLNSAVARGRANSAAMPPAPEKVPSPAQGWTQPPFYKPKKPGEIAPDPGPAETIRPLNTAETIEWEAGWRLALAGKPLPDGASPAAMAGYAKGLPSLTFAPSPAPAAPAKVDPPAAVV